MAALALFLQVISNQKFIGYLLIIVVLAAADRAAAACDFEHNLYIYAGAPAHDRIRT